MKSQKEVTVEEVREAIRNLDSLEDTCREASPGPWNSFTSFDDMSGKFSIGLSMGGDDVEFRTGLTSGGKK